MKTKHLILIFSLILLIVSSCKKRQYEFVVRNHTDYVINEIDVHSESLSVQAHGSSAPFVLRLARKGLGLYRHSINIGVMQFSDSTGQYAHTHGLNVENERFSEEHINYLDIKLNDTPEFPENIFDIDINY